MAKFDAGKVVERLEYDFTDYGGGSGAVSEPSTVRVHGYFDNMRAMFKEAKALQEQAGVPDDPDSMSEDEVQAAMERMDEASTSSGDVQRKTLEHLAYLCGADWKYVAKGTDTEVVADSDGGEWVLRGGSPTLGELQALPFRVLQAFSTWLLEEIKPKRTTPGTKR